MLPLIKTMATFSLLAVALNATLPPGVVEGLGLSPPLLLAFLCALMGVWLVHQIHFLAAALVVTLVVAVNLPLHSVGLHQNVLLLGLVALVGGWVAQNMSSLLALLILVVGLGLLLPEELAAGAQLETRHLAGLLCAMILTPVVELFTTRRKGGAL